MTEPAMLVLDDELAALDELRGTLDRRYGREYLVVGESSTAAGLDRLARLAADDRPVTIVCAPAAMLDTGGAEFFAMAHRLNPTAKRVLILPRGGPSAPSLRVPALLLQDQSVSQPVLQAMTLGVVDTYLASPHRGRDEGFHLAVYTSSEGLSTLLLEREAIGGQAGSSSLIRNYLGFPRGTSGRGLASRAFAQVWAFGADTVVSWPVIGLRPAETGYLLMLADGREAHSRSVVIATGVSYRRLDAPGLEPLIGTGVFYGAAASEARAMAGRRVFIAGGANSAGQAAVNLARHARHVTLLVRRDSVAATMSQYLIDEINGTANIDIRHNTEVAGAEGDIQLEALVLHDNTTGITESVHASALFVLVGAEPRTDWLPASIQRDDRGFLLTGSDLRVADAPGDWPLQRPPLALETSLPGVFAAGDVRRGSIKRVASAVGEGSIAATEITQYLQEPLIPHR